jgi:hypothetical protein
MEKVHGKSEERYRTVLATAFPAMSPETHPLSHIPGTLKIWESSSRVGGFIWH